MNLIKIRLHFFISAFVSCTESIFKDIALEKADKFIVTKKCLHDKNRFNNRITIVFIVHCVFLCVFILIDGGNTTSINYDYVITATELYSVH